MALTFQGTIKAGNGTTRRLFWGRENPREGSQKRQRARQGRENTHTRFESGIDARQTGWQSEDFLESNNRSILEKLQARA